VGGGVRDQVTCSFCGKEQQQVKKIIAGPKAHICDECIELCNEILREQTVSASPRAGSSPQSAASSGAPGWNSYAPSDPAPLPLALQMIERQLSAMSQRVASLAERAEADQT